MVVQSKGSIRGGCRHDGVCSGRFVLLIGCVVKVQDGVSPGDAEKTWGKKGGSLAAGCILYPPHYITGVTSSRGGKFQSFRHLCHHAAEAH